MTNGNNNEGRGKKVLFEAPHDLVEEFDSNTDNRSEVLRAMMESYNDIGGEYDIDDELDRINVIILKTYRNAIQQNIHVMQNQVDKIDEELEKYEKDEADNEVLVEIDLDIASKSL